MRTSSLALSGPATACAIPCPLRGMQARSPISTRGTCATAATAKESERATAKDPARTALRMMALLEAASIAIHRRCASMPAGGNALRAGGGAEDAVAVGLHERRRPQLAFAAAHHRRRLLLRARLPQRDRKVEEQQRLSFTGVAAAAEVAHGVAPVRGAVGDLGRR